MKKQIKNRAVTQGRFLYLYFVIGGIAMFLYAVVSVLTRAFTEIKLPFIYTFLPIVFLASWFLGMFTVRNYKMLWLFVKDTQQGRLLLHLTDSTHFGTLHKEKLVKWVYLPQKTIRNEMWLKLSDKVHNGIELSKEEKRKYKYSVVILPQQLLDGVNKAIMINALIWAHKNIQVLDDEVREILELTDDNMAKFDMSMEINRCRKKEYQDQYDRLLKKGLEAVERDKA